MTNCIVKSSLSSAQNSVRCWSLLLMLASLTGAWSFYTQQYVAGAAAIVALVAAIALLIFGPNEKEQGGTTYKVLLVVTTLAMIVNGVGIYRSVMAHETLKGLFVVSLQYCCTDPTFATCVAGQLPCAPVATTFEALFVGLYIAFGSMALIFLVEIGVCVKSFLALKSLSAVGDVGKASAANV